MISQQFKTAKRPQAPGDAAVRKRVFRDNFVTVLFEIDLKE